MRPISSTSPKPRVVTRPTAPTRRSTIALVTKVVPCASEAQRPATRPTAARPSSTPPAGLAGVVGTLSDVIRPAESQATRSVKVPPTSTPTRTPSAITRSASCDHAPRASPSCDAEASPDLVGPLRVGRNRLVRIERHVDDQQRGRLRRAGTREYGAERGHVADKLDVGDAKSPSERGPVHRRCRQILTARRLVVAVHP